MTLWIALVKWSATDDAFFFFFSFFFIHKNNHRTWFTWTVTTFWPLDARLFRTSFLSSTATRYGAWYCLWKSALGGSCVSVLLFLIEITRTHKEFFVWNYMDPPLDLLYEPATRDDLVSLKSLVFTNEAFICLHDTSHLITIRYDGSTTKSVCMLNRFCRTRKDILWKISLV